MIVSNARRAYALVRAGSKEFVALSKKIALHLFDHHSGVTSPGLLSVMDCAVQAEQGLAILKLERKSGAR